MKVYCLFLIRQADGTILPQRTWCEKVATILMVGMQHHQDRPQLFVTNRFQRISSL